MAGSEPPAATHGTPSQNTRGRVIFASLIGTAIESYDFFVYGTASVLVFPALFFPKASEIHAILSAFAIFGVAFVARPLGSVLFGHLGDRLGRKRTLVLSLLIMGVATFLVGFLPAATGPFVVIAPLLLVLLRFAQGLAVAGEWSGAVLVATENAPPNQRAIYGTFPQLGVPIGLILATAIFVGLQRLLTQEQFISWGWRVPFFLSAFLVPLGLWVRLNLVESMPFQKIVEHRKIERSPFLATMKHHWRRVVVGTFVMLTTFVIFQLMTSFALTYGTAPATVEQATTSAAVKGQTFDTAKFVPGLGIAHADFLMMIIVGVVFFGIFTMVSGPLAEKFGRRKFLMGVTAASLVFGLSWTSMFGPGKGAAMAGLIIGFTLTGMAYGPMGAILPELFPSNVRYTGSAMAYSLSSVLGAAPTSFVAIALWQAGRGNTRWVGIYLAVAAAVSLVALYVSSETRDIDY